MNGNVEELAIGAVIAIVIVYLLAIVLSIAQYVMFALGLYDTARKRRIRHAWLAWVPLIGNWTLGAVVDYHADRRGQSRRWRTVLLWIGIAMVASWVLLYVMMFVGFFTLDLLEMEEAVEAAGWGVLGGVLVAYVLMIVSCMAYLPCYAVCLYKVYEETVPEKAVKYLLLSYLVPLASGICMMNCARVPVEPVAPAEIAAAAPQPDDGFIPVDLFAGVDETKEN